MRGLLRSFLGRARRFFKAVPKREAVKSKKRYNKAIQERTNGMWHYEPTNIIYTLGLRSGDEDLARRWARVKEYTNGAFDEDSRDSRRMMKGIMNGHLKEKAPSLDPNILNLPPIRVEILLENYFKSGYHVPIPAQDASEYA